MHYERHPSGNLDDADEQTPTFDVPPRALDDLCLESAIRHLVETWDERSSLQFGLHLALNGRRLDPAVSPRSIARCRRQSLTSRAMRMRGGSGCFSRQQRRRFA